MEQSRARSRAKSSVKSPVPARRATEPPAERAQFVGPSEPLDRLKSAALPRIGPAGMAALQRSMGNKAIQRLLDPGARKTVRRAFGDEELQQPQRMLQRHWLEGEEKVQAQHDPALAREHDAAAAAAAPAHGRRRGFDDPAYFQRRADERAHIGRQLWANPAGSLQRQDDKKDGGVAAPPSGKVESVSFTPVELPADGKTTTQAKAVTSGGANVSKWEIVGDGFGASVDSNGLVTAGSDTKGAENVTVKVQATDEKGGGSGTGTVTLWDAKVWQAKTDYPKFAAGTYTYDNFAKGFNGKFDVAYSPAANLATITVKLKFAWPEEKAPVPDASNLWGFAPMLKHANYELAFMSQVQKQWSGRYQFQNIREPKSIWGKLNPVNLQVGVKLAETDPHFTVEVRDRAVNPSAGEATAVGGGVLKLYQGDDVPKPAFNPSTAQGEEARVKRNTPTPIQFGLNSEAVPGADASKLQFLGTYLSRIANPKFKVDVVGHASATGDPVKNQALSEKRAQAVVDILTGAGAAAKHNVVGSGKGDAGAGKTDDWRKVEVASTAPVGWQNMQDTTAHEFGHMLGLGDEYPATGVAKATHYDLVAKALGKDYAEQVAKRNEPDSASIMDGGNDVRIQHYVTLWSALVETTLKAADPDPKFGYDDWKFVGT
jgi:outer membrane protein OmpA-like peptidoglycan-associated protein